MIKMIVTDLDDTLIGRKNGITDFTRDTFALCREKGILTAFATARVAIAVTKELVPVSTDIKILSNGAMAFAGERELFYEGMGAERTDALLARLKQLGARDILVSCKKDTYWESDRIADSRVLYRAIWHDFSEPLHREADQICFLLPDQKAVEKLKEDFPEFAWITYRDGSHGIARRGVSKLNGVKKTAALYGISLSDIAAFGDDLGDCEMLKNCGMGIAVGNAVPEAKRAADYVTDSNEADGVARFIQEKIFSGK